MITIKDHTQQPLVDPWSFLSPKRRRLLEQSWAELFQREILAELPVKEFSSCFTSDFGRPSKELHTVLGVLVLQQMHDLSDEETVNHLAFNIQWHYALNITEESDSAKYMCPKTLWTMRHLAIEHDLDSLSFDAITDKLARVFKVNTDQQRIDSVQITSNMRRLGRIGLFSKSIHKFLVTLKRTHQDLFENIDQRIRDTYLSEKALGCFSRVKPSESHKTLRELSRDLLELVQQFKGHKAVAAMPGYHLLERVLEEHCTLRESEAEDSPSVTVKKAKEIPADSLQNPSDPDATYSGHKGQGYQVQVMETYCSDEDAKAETLNLITHVQVEPAHESDVNALIPALESTQERGLGPKEALADSLYGSDDNCQAAEQLGVEIVAPTMGRPRQQEETLTLSEFAVSPTGDILACPQGYAPVHTKIKKTRHTAAFDSQQCSQCPHQSTCPVKSGKKHYYLRYTDKDLRLATRRAYEQTDAFQERYRWRAGIEGTMSEYDRRTGVKHLRIRGLQAVRFCATLKAIGINIFRATAVQKATDASKNVFAKAKSCHDCCISLVKERFFATLRTLQRIFILTNHYCEYMVIKYA
jgi:hypothetical protein